jgi:hypothetical protein
MNKTDQNHPIWRLLNIVIVAVIVIVFSYTSASNFDETEVKMIGQIILLIGGYEAVKTLIPRRPE